MVSRDTKVFFIFLVLLGFCYIWPLCYSVVALIGVIIFEAFEADLLLNAYEVFCKIKERVPKDKEKKAIFITGRCDKCCMSYTVHFGYKHQSFIEIMFLVTRLFPI